MIDTDAFIADGFVRVADAFPREPADECRTILWRDTGCDPDDPATWTKPVIRLGHYAREPFPAGPLRWWTPSRAGARTQ